jgi:hypothetical protein
MIRYRIKTRAEMLLMADFISSTGIPATWPANYTNSGLLGQTIPENASYDSYLRNYCFSGYIINEKYIVEMDISDTRCTGNEDKGTLIFSSNYIVTGTIIGYKYTKDGTLSDYVVTRTDNKGWILYESDVSRYQIDSKYIGKNVYLFHKSQSYVIKNERNLVCLPSPTIMDSLCSLQSHKNILSNGTRIKSKYDPSVSGIIIGNYTTEDPTTPLYLIIRDDGIGWKLKENSRKKYNVSTTYTGIKVWSVADSTIESINEDSSLGVFTTDRCITDIEVAKIKSPEQTICINKRATLLTPPTIKKRVLI